jgi:hypothetical protein
MKLWIALAALVMSACGPSEMERTCTHWAGVARDGGSMRQALAAVCFTGYTVEACETGLTCSAPATNQLGVCTIGCATDADCRQSIGGRSFSDAACVNGACYPTCPGGVGEGARCDADLYCYSVLGRSVCLPPNC